MNTSAVLFTQVYPNAVTRNATTALTFTGTAAGGEVCGFAAACTDSVCDAGFAFSNGTDPQLVTRLDVSPAVDLRLCCRTVNATDCVEQTGTSTYMRVRRRPRARVGGWGGGGGDGGGQNLGADR